MKNLLKNRQAALITKIEKEINNYCNEKHDEWNPFFFKAEVETIEYDNIGMPRITFFVNSIEKDYYNNFHRDMKMVAYCSEWSDEVWIDCLDYNEYYESLSESYAVSVR